MRSVGWLRKILRLLAALCLVIGVVLAGAILWLIAPVILDPVAGFEARKGTLQEARVTAVHRLSDGELTELTLVSTSGLVVELSVRVPDEQLPERPAVMLLVGQRTGRDAVRLPTRTRGVVAAAISYPYPGKHGVRGLAQVLQARHAQRGILDTPPAVMLALDYLRDLSTINPDRIELAGVSFGAFLAPVTGAVDPRFRRVWLIHGAGETGRVIDRSIREQVGWSVLRSPLSRLLAVAAGERHMAPERWVGRIAPRPVVAVNARDDLAFPDGAVETLHAALGQPSSVIWMDGGHITPGDRQAIDRITELIFTGVAGASAVP